MGISDLLLKHSLVRDNDRSIASLPKGSSVQTGLLAESVFYVLRQHSQNSPSRVRFDSVQRPSTILALRQQGYEVYVVRHYDIGAEDETISLAVVEQAESHEIPGGLWTKGMDKIQTCGGGENAMATLPVVSVSGRTLVHQSSLP